MKASVSIRFYEELNDFLCVEKRKKEFQVSLKGARCVKEIIATQGVPQTEVDLILVNGNSVSFSYILQDGDRISVYPMFEAFDISDVTRLREKPLRTPKFILDTDLDRLAKYLRMLGFDTLYRSEYQVREIVNLSLAEKRTILTRNRELLLGKEVDRGYLVKNTVPEKQLQEIMQRFDLTRISNSDFYLF